MVGRFLKFDATTAMSAILGGGMIFASSSVAPIAFKVVGFALGTGTGLAITGGATLASSVGILVYCHKNEIKWEDIKGFVISSIRNLLVLLVAAKAAQKIDETTNVVTNTVSQIADVVNSLPTATGSLGGFAVGYSVEQAVVKMGVDNPKHSGKIGDGAADVASSVITHFAGGNVVLAVLGTQISRAIVPMVKNIPVIGGGAQAIGAMTAVGSTTAMNKFADKLTMLPNVSNYNIAVFVGTGVGKVAEGILGHFGFKNYGQIRDGFELVTTSATAFGLGADPCGAVFGLTLSKATKGGVPKLAIFAKLPEQAAGSIADIAGTLATPGLSILAKTMSSFLPTSDPLVPITYGVGIAVEGLFKESKSPRFKNNAKALGLGVSSLTSLGGAVISGTNPLNLIIATLFSNLLRTGVKNAAVAAKCEEKTAETIGTAVGALALPVVGMASAKVVAEYPQAALVGVAAVGLFVAYHSNVHGYIAEQALLFAKPVVIAIRADLERQRELDIKNFGSLENAFHARQKMSKDMQANFKQSQHQYEVCQKLHQQRLQQPSSANFDAKGPSSYESRVLGINLGMPMLPKVHHNYAPKFTSPIGKVFSPHNFR